jgi:hypothetical protein
VQSPDQLRVGIERALCPNTAMRAAADRERDYYFYQLDGQASRRLKERIETLYAARRYGAAEQ